MCPAQRYSAFLIRRNEPLENAERTSRSLLVEPLGSLAVRTHETGHKLCLEGAIEPAHELKAERNVPSQPIRRCGREHSESGSTTGNSRWRAKATGTSWQGVGASIREVGASDCRFISRGHDRLYSEQTGREMSDYILVQQADKVVSYNQLPPEAEVFRQVLLKSGSSHNSECSRDGRIAVNGIASRGEPDVPPFHRARLDVGTDRARVSKASGVVPGLVAVRNHTFVPARSPASNGKVRSPA